MSALSSVMERLRRGRRGTAPAPAAVCLTMPAGAEDQAEAFYGRALGMTRSALAPGRSVCRYEAGRVVIDLTTVEEIGERRDDAVTASFVVGDLDAVRDRLIAAGATFSRGVSTDGVARGFTVDPFGNPIELVSLR